MPTQFIPGPGDSDTTPLERAIRGGSQILNLVQSVQNNAMQNQLLKTQIAASAADMQLRQQTAMTEQQMAPSRIRMMAADANTAEFDLEQAKQESVLAPEINKLKFESAKLDLERAQLGVKTGTTELEQHRYSAKLMQDEAEHHKNAIKEYIEAAPNAEERRVRRLNTSSSYMLDMLNKVADLNKKNLDIVNDNAKQTAMLKGFNAENEKLEIDREATIVTTAMQGDLGFEMMNAKYGHLPVMKVMSAFREKHPELVKSPKELMIGAAKSIVDTDPETAAFLYVTSTFGLETAKTLLPDMQLEKSTEEYLDTNGVMQSRPVKKSRITEHGLTGGGIINMIKNSRVGKNGITFTIPNETQKPANTNANPMSSTIRDFRPDFNRE